MTQYLGLVKTTHAKGQGWPRAVMATKPQRRSFTRSVLSGHGRHVYDASRPMAEGR